MRGQKETRACANCGNPLTRLVSQARNKTWYCDARCQAAHAPSPITLKRTVKLERVCACGRAFTTYPSVNSEHCSRACSSRFNPRKPRLGETTPCLVCGTPVYADRGQRAKGQGRYCSLACHNTAQTKAPVIKTCPTCGAEMRLKPSQSTRIYCSRVCQTTARTLRPLARTHNGRPARLDAKGYVVLYEPAHPNKSLHGWQLEHRLVAESALGRYLRPDEAVHHVNGIKDDNRPENLEVMDATAHAVLSVGDYRDSINRQMTELAEYRRRFGPLSKE